MKFLLSISLLSFFLSPAFAGTAVKLSCSLRKNVTISRFHYQLSTMKWGDHFQVASGMRQAQTKNHIPYRVTSFRNGDDLVFFRTVRSTFSSTREWRRRTVAWWRNTTSIRSRNCRIIKSPLPESGLLRQQFAGHRLLDNRDGGK